MADFCCGFMESQLTYTCSQHEGRTCPDIIVDFHRGQFGDGRLILMGRNQNYICHFCPYCGTEVTARMVIEARKEK